MADNTRVFFDFSIKGAPPQRVIFELFKDVVPITAENFRALCTGEKGFSSRQPDKLLSYKGSVVHRIVPGFMIQGGDFITHNGKSGESIYGGEFDDENLELKCDAEGLLVMANKGPNTNLSQWFITLAPAEHLNGKHVVFGRVQSGFNVVQEIAQLETDPKKHRPLGGDRVVEIVHCGQLERRQKPKLTAEDPIKKSPHTKSDQSHERKRHFRSGSESSLSGSQRTSLTSSESSGAARRKRKIKKKEKKEKKKARKADKTKKLKFKDRKEESKVDQGCLEEELASEQIHSAQLEAQRLRKLEEDTARIEEERRRKARALELLQTKQNRTSKGGVIYKGRGAMHYQDSDATLSRTRAWKD